jgi:hypothetical protein
MAKMVGAALAYFLLAALYGCSQPSTGIDSARLLSSENAYNPIPSPDGKYIAYVATEWGHSRHENEFYIGGMGRASLVSDVEVMDSSGKVLAPHALYRMFLGGWAADSKALICYRDRRYAVVTPDGTTLESARQVTLPTCQQTLTNPLHT